MFGAKFKGYFDGAKVLRAVRGARLRWLYRAAGYIRKVARHSIKSGSEPGPAGQPPHTQTKRLRNAIVFAVDRAAEEATIGPAFSIIRDVGGAHEHGGHFRNETYPARSFMGPALEKTEPHLTPMWENSIR